MEININLITGRASNADSKKLELIFISFHSPIILFKFNAHNVAASSIVFFKNEEL
jgi:hypothetical protein